MQEKVVPLAGDITKEGLGLEPATFDDLAKEMDVVVNIAATTHFYQRLV
jgi:fatty acyl-CoA reductase